MRCLNLAVWPFSSSSSSAAISSSKALVALATFSSFLSCRPSPMRRALSTISTTITPFVYGAFPPEDSRHIAFPEKSRPYYVTSCICQAGEQQKEPACHPCGPLGGILASAITSSDAPHPITSRRSPECRFRKRHSSSRDGDRRRTGARSPCSRTGRNRVQSAPSRTAPRRWSSARRCAACDG